METKLFTRRVQEYMSDDEDTAIQATMVADSDAGEASSAGD